MEAYFDIIVIYCIRSFIAQELNLAQEQMEWVNKTFLDKLLRKECSNRLATVIGLDFPVVIVASSYLAAASYTNCVATEDFTVNPQSQEHTIRVSCSYTGCLKTEGLGALLDL